MRKTTRHFGATAVLLACPALAAAASPCRIINIANDFLRYHEQARSRNEAGRIYRWNTLLEAKHPAFFRDAIYRRKSGAERERYKAGCIRRFWRDVAPRMARIRKANAAVERQLRDTIESFRRRFPDFDAARSFYVTISLSFRGKVVTVGGKDALALGLERLDQGGPQVPNTIAHELFHLYHFQTFSVGGGLYRTLWAEGLASYASGVLVPGHRMSTCLGFPAAKMNRCAELLPAMAATLKQNLGSRDHRLRRIYFGAEPNDTPIPPEAGYYVGFLIAQRLAKTHALAQLARLKASAVYPLLERELTRLADGK